MNTLTPLSSSDLIGRDANTFEVRELLSTMTNNIRSTFGLCLSGSEYNLVFKKWNKRFKDALWPGTYL